MATKNFRSTVLEPTSEFARGDKLRFTALATVSEVLKGSFSETTIGEDGVYSVDLQYGKHRIDYKPYEGVWRHFADIEVNADTLATTLQDLALSSVPTTDETVLVLQGILADAEMAKTESAAMRDEAAASAIDAAASAAEAVSAMEMNVSFYVDPDYAGADSDGTSGKPFRSIADAISACDAGRSLKVLCKPTTYVINSRINASHLRSLEFYSVLSPSAATVRFSHTIDGDKIQLGSILMPNYSIMSAYYVNITIDDYPDSVTPLAPYNYATVMSTDRSNIVNVMIDNSSIEFSGIPLLSSSAGRASRAQVLLSNISVTRHASIRSNAKLFDTQMGSISAVSVSLNGLSASDLVSNPDNWQSNIAWS